MAHVSLSKNKWLKIESSQVSATKSCLLWCPLYPYEATGHKMETVHYSGPVVQVRLADVAPVVVRLAPENRKKERKLNASMNVDHICRPYTTNKMVRFHS